MGILILNRFSHQIAPYKDWLTGIDMPIVMLCDSSQEGGIPEVYQYLKFFPNWKNNGNIEREAIELHQKYNFQLIIALNESDIIRAAKLREILGIEGQSVKSAEAFRNKVTMKTILKEKGITVSEFKEVKHPLDLLTFCENQEFPLVFKPIAGYGSHGTRILSSWDDVMEVLEKSAFVPSMVEKFVVGEMYHIDGVWKNGEVEFICASKYVNDCLSFLASTYNGGYLLDQNDTLHQKLINFTRQTLEVLPTPDACAFHSEVFVTPEGELVLCEIASRAGGTLIVPMIEKAYDYSITKNSILAQAHLRTSHASPRKFSVGYLLIPPHVGTCKKIPN